MKAIAWIVLSASALTLAGCSKHLMGHAAERSGSERSAPELMVQYGCPTCHVIPHVPGAVGQVGPSLAGVSQRSYIAGALPNTPENVVSWIMHPQHLRPGTAMPEMGVTEPDARRIQMFLESER